MANNKEKKPEKKSSKETKPSVFAQIIRFFREVIGEVKKLSWPTRKDLISYTVTVIAFIVVLAVVIYVLDMVFGQGLALLGNL